MSALDSIYSKATNLPAFATFKSTIVIFFGICKNFQWFFSALTASYFKFWWGKSLMKRSWVDQKKLIQHYLAFVICLAVLSSWVLRHIKTSHFFRGSPQEVFLGKGVLKIIIRFTGENPHRSVISISCFALLCSPVNLLYIFRTPFSYEHFWRTAFVCCLYLKRNTGLREQNSSCKLRLNVLLIYIF